MLAPLFAVIGLAVSLYLAGEQWGNQMAGFAWMVTCDNFGVMFKMLFGIAALLTVFAAYRFLKQKGIHRPEFYALVLISITGMMVMANSTDLVVMFLGLEVMSLPLYVMAGFNRRSLESNESGIKYFFMGAFASAFQ